MGVKPFNIIEVNKAPNKVPITVDDFKIFANTGKISERKQREIDSKKK